MASFISGRQTGGTLRRTLEYCDFYPGGQIMNEQIKSDEIAPVLTASEVERMVIKNLPPIDHHGERVEHVGCNSIRVRLPYNSAFMGAEPWQDGSGQVFSGPMVM